MGYKSDYLKNVKETNASIFHKAFTDRNDFENYGIKEIEYRICEPFPYILFSLDYDKICIDGEIICSSCLLLNIDMTEYFPNIFHPFIYLPVIAEPDKFPEKYAKLINPETTLRHELIHLNDIIELFDGDPDYQIKKYNCNLNQAENLEDLKKSLEFELSDLFYLEPRAFKDSFECNERKIYEFFMGRTMFYESSDFSEFLQMQLMRYLQSIENNYKEKIKELNIEDPSLFPDALNKYGLEVYGATPYLNYKKVCSEYVNKLLQHTISHK